MKPRFIILLLCCSGIRANPVDSTKLANPKGQTASVPSKDQIVINDEEFPPLPAPEKPILQRTSSVKDLVKFFEEKETEGSRPASPVLSRRPGTPSQTVKNDKPIEKSADLVDDTRKTVEPKVPEKQPIQSPASQADLSNGGLQKSTLTVSLNPEDKPAPVNPGKTRTQVSPSAPSSQKKVEQKPIPDTLEDLIIEDVEDLRVKPETPKSVVPIAPLQRQPAVAKTETKIADESKSEDPNKAQPESLKNRPTLPKEVQDELIATVAKKQAEREKAKAEEAKLKSDVVEDKSKTNQPANAAVSDDSSKASPKVPAQGPVRGGAIHGSHEDPAEEGPHSPANPAAKPLSIRVPAKAPVEPALKSEGVKDDTVDKLAGEGVKPKAPSNPALKSSASADLPKSATEEKKEKEEKVHQKSGAVADDSKPVEDKIAGKDKPAVPARSSPNPPSRTAAASSSKKDETQKDGEVELGNKNEKQAANDKKKPNAKTTTEDAEDKTEKEKTGFFSKIFG